MTTRQFRRLVPYFILAASLGAACLILNGCTHVRGLQNLDEVRNVAERFEKAENALQSLEADTERQLADFRAATRKLVQGELKELQDAQLQNLADFRQALIEDADARLDSLLSTTSQDLSAEQKELRAELIAEARAQRKRAEEISQEILRAQKEQRDLARKLDQQFDAAVAGLERSLQDKLQGLNSDVAFAKSDAQRIAAETEARLKELETVLEAAGEAGQVSAPLTGGTGAIFGMLATYLAGAIKRRRQSPEQVLADGVDQLRKKNHTPQRIAETLKKQADAISPTNQNE